MFHSISSSRVQSIRKCSPSSLSTRVSPNETMSSVRSLQGRRNKKRVSSRKRDRVRISISYWLKKKIN